MSNLTPIAFRLLRNDLLSGRLLLIVIATSLAVAATGAVRLFTHHIELTLVSESSALLAGDLAVNSTRPLAQELYANAAAAKLETTQVIGLRTVVAYEDRIQMAELRAVSESYPLRGSVRISDAPFAVAQDVVHGPSRGQVWADGRMLQLLDVEVGDSITIGKTELVIEKVLLLEPDRGGDAFSIAPRILVTRFDLEQAGLLLPGTRASYRLLMAGPRDALAKFKAGFVPAPGLKLIDPSTARPEIRDAFQQAERYLSLVAFACVLLAVTGVATAGLNYANHHRNTAAILKTIGLASRPLLALFALELVLLAACAALLGNALAWSVYRILIAQLTAAIPPISLIEGLVPALEAGSLGLIVLLGFCLPQFAAVAEAPVNQKIGASRANSFGFSALPVAAALLVLLLLLPWHLEHRETILIVLAGMLGTAITLALAARLTIAVMNSARGQVSLNWRMGLANISRNAGLSVLQITAIGLGIGVVCLIAAVRGDLITQWRDRLPPSAADHFLINIDPKDVDQMRTFLADHQLSDPGFYPMIRGRLVGINDRSVGPDDYEQPRARRLVNREFNLSWAALAKPHNRITAGQWWSEDAAAGQFSVETGIAETLGIAIGDRLSFNVASDQVSGVVTNLREVNWDDFKVNFFVEATPPTLRELPTTYITAFKAGNGNNDFLPDLVSRFPSVTVIDVSAIMLQVRSVMDRVASALLWVFLFALGASAIILVTVVQTTQKTRTVEIALLKALGATKDRVVIATLCEFATLGAIAGAIGSLGAIATGWWVAAQVFSIPYTPNVWLPIIASAAGALGVTGIGLGVVRSSFTPPVMATIRAND